MTGLAPAAILWMLTILGVVAAFSPLTSSEDDDGGDGTVDEHGICRVPGEEPREVGQP